MDKRNPSGENRGGETIAAEPITDTGIPVRLNPNVQGLRPSATLTLNQKCVRLREQGRKIYGLGFGQSPFPVPQPVVEALRANAFQNDYLPVKGLVPLRNAVAEFHRRLQHIPATGQNILIGPGSKQLIFLVQLTYQGDLIIPSPSWVSYEPQANLLGRKVHWLQTQKQNGWRLLPEELEKHCRKDPDRPRLVILNYPNNPTGLTFREHELQELARVAQKYRLLLLSDEIYGELHHSARHTSIARYYPQGTIISGGLSKWCSAGGWRLGTLYFPPALHWLLETVSSVASETYSAVSAPIQYAAVRAFQGCSEIEHYLFQSRRILRSLGKWVSDRLRASGVDVHAPEGAFYLFPDFSPQQETLGARGITNAFELCERLLVETGVALLPGADFGRPLAELTCRLAYVDFDGGACLAAAAEVPAEQELSEQLLRKNCGNVVTAIELISRWIR